MPRTFPETIPEGTRNNTLTSIAGSLRYRGMDENGIAHELGLINHSRCEPPLPDSEVRTIARSIARYKPGSQKWGGDTRYEIALHQAYIHSLPCWRGKVGNRNLRILSAIHDLCIDVGTRGVWFSTRQISRVTGITRKTVSKGIHDLLEQDFIWPGVEGKFTGEKAPTYTLMMGMKHSATTPLPIIDPTVGISGVTGLCLWDEDCLGESAARVYVALSPDVATTTAQLQSVVSLHIETIRAKLRLLENEKLAFRKGREWFRLDVDLVAKCEEMEAGKRRAVLAHKYDAETEGYHRWLQHTYRSYPRLDDNAA
jgi:hypothetical protein